MYTTRLVMKIKQCEGCKYYKDIDFGNKHLLGSSWSGYCTYYPKTTRKQLRCIRSIVNCNNYDKEKIMGKDNSLDKFVERYPTYIEALDMIDNLKEQLETSESQNKRVLEKLELITKSNQDLERQLEEKEKELRENRKNKKR